MPTIPSFLFRTSFVLISLLFSMPLFSQSADTDKGCAPLTVNFTPPAGSVSWFWDFKDGGSSVLQNPSNIFTTPGTYNVEFKNSPNGAVVGTVTITVWPKPDLDFQATPLSGCIPLNVQFQDKSVVTPGIQVLDLLWVFGDGGSETTIPNPTHTYNSAGSFTVSLEYVTNYQSCNVTEVFPDAIKTSSKPIAAFATLPAPAQSCAPPLNVAVSNNSSGSGTLTYNWDFGNGFTSTLANPPAQTYTQNGVFPIKLTVTDDLGCSATIQTNVSIGNPTPSFNYKDTVCLKEPVLFNNTSPVGLYTWNFGPNASPNSSILKSPTVVFNAPGTYQVTLTVTAPGGCIGTTTQPIHVDSPDASFSINPNYSCNEPASFSLSGLSAAAVSWEWDAPTGPLLPNSKNVVYTYVNKDTTGYTSLGMFMDSIQLIVTTAAGCRDTSKQKVTVWQPNARFMPDKIQGCAPLQVVFADSSFSNENIVQWSWFFDDGSPLLVQNNGNSVTHTFTQAGEYDVQLIIRNSAGCIDTSYKVRIEVGIPLSGDFTADKTEICPFDTVQFTSLATDPRIDGWHFYSDEDRLWHCFQNQNPSWVYKTQTGALDVSLMLEYNGCFNEVTKADFIQVKGPIAHLFFKTTCENTLSFDFENRSDDATKVTWVLGDGDSSMVDVFTHVYAMTGPKTVYLYAENPDTGCPVSVDSATVYPTQLKSDFDLDYYICGGQTYPLDGSKAKDVNAVCYKGYTWYFDFQRPIRTDEVSTDIQFPSPGIHSVCLEVEDINGCRDTLCDTVKVFFLDPAFTMSKDSICLPATVNFTDFSTADTTIVSWSWDFGDGSPAASGQNVTHTFTNPPVSGENFFNVTLTIKDVLGCPSSFTRKLHLYKPVSSIIMSPPPNICVGESIQFTGTDFTQQGSNLEFAWNFGDGGTGAGQTINHTFLQHGSFTVTMIFTEAATGCKDSKMATVTVQSYPDAQFVSNVDNATILCYPQNIQLTNASTSDYPVSILWDLGNGQTASGNDAATVFPKGTYTIKMYATTTYGCMDSVLRSFTVVGPEGNFDMDKFEICLGDTITFNIKDTVDISSFSWSFGDGTTLDNVGTVSHAYNFFPPSGQTLAKLILKGEDDACAFAVEKPVIFSKIDALFSALNDPLCLGQEHQFVNASVSDDAWLWSFGDGTSATTENPAHEYDAEGVYTVSLIVTDLPLGCMDTLTQTVSVTGIPNFEAVGGIVCAGDTAMIGLVTPVPGAVYSWTPANSILPPKDQANIKVNPTETTIYTVSVTIPGTGCMDTDTALVFVPDDYTGARNLDTLVEQGASVLLPILLDPAYNYTWSPSNPGVPPIVTPVDSSLIFNVTITDDYGCAELKYTFAVRIFPQEIKAPNVFTPDGDGVNDAFVLSPDGEPGLIQIEYLRVYDRWGEKVFEGKGTDATVAWDGKIDGKPAPVDVYAWTASVTFLTGKKLVLKGDLTLLR